MDLVKDLMKDEKKRKAGLRKKKAAMDGSCSSLSYSKHSLRSINTSDSSTIGANDPFHAKRVMKVVNLWEKVKRASNPISLGEAFMKQVSPKSWNEEQCLVVVETIDCLIHLMGPDMDEDELEEASTKLEQGGVPLETLGEVFATCMNSLLGGELSQKEIDIMDASIGMILRNMASEV